MTYGQKTLEETQKLREGLEVLENFMESNQEDHNWEQAGYAIQKAREQAQVIEGMIGKLIRIGEI